MYMCRCSPHAQQIYYIHFYRRHTFLVFFNSRAIGEGITNCGHMSLQLTRLYSTQSSSHYYGLALSIDAIDFDDDIHDLMGTPTSAIL